jgi:hypothetical protein
MNIEVPLYRQEKPNTCALACLRMVLATFGTQVEEGALEAEARMEPGGTTIDELERLGRRFDLAAEIRETTVEGLRRLLAEGCLPTVYLDRALFDLTPRQRAKHSIRAATIHTVVPTRVTVASVVFHDPLPPRVTRRSVRVFSQAHAHLGSYSVVCWKRP